MHELHKILVPIDFSEHSRRALDEAIGLALKFDAELHLLHCYQLYPLGGIPPYDVVMPADLERGIREGALELLAEWRKQADARGVKVMAHLATGAASSTIADLAETIGADLIVMGTHGRTGLTHVLLGSVAERTIRITPCPVLTMKHEAVAR
jgi:nucleotide-binding universal stress UspA family protein